MSSSAALDQLLAELPPCGVCIFSINLPFGQSPARCAIGIELDPFD